MESVTLTGAAKKAAADFPSRRAIAVPGRLELSHARLQQIIDGAAGRLVAAGLRPGDVVALAFPNTVEVLPFFSFPPLSICSIDLFAPRPRFLLLTRGLCCCRSL